MVTKIGIIEASKFNLANYHEVVKESDVHELVHRNTLYKKITAFAHYIDGYPFDYVFNNEEELQEWYVFVPQTITPRQGMLLLSRRGQLSMIEQVIYNLETITGDKQLAEEAIIEWNKASSWDRYNNTVLFVADLLMWSDEDKDEFFIEASKIE